MRPQVPIASLRFQESHDAQLRDQIGRIGINHLPKVLFARTTFTKLKLRLPKHQPGLGRLRIGFQDLQRIRFGVSEVSSFQRFSRILKPHVCGHAGNNLQGEHNENCHQNNS